ncbi:hypothetical protein O1L44_32100 [Streptomyces noursei]|uniref:DUF7224 domain-containing protein n=1 Tax=Streptomyces noursei TaxID=1971 RepID=UPI00081D1B0D|nr:hypothetical protein SNOUR_34750 [Streptomyces noursei ATCC 11455]MCZ0996711.1 hypothetical protein [Streptomyces noursei]
MLWRTVLRSSSATWLAPLLAAFVALLLADDLTAGVTPGYWPSALGHANFALHFVAPACATASAWEGSRLTRGNVTHWAPTRSGLTIALPLLAPVFVLGAVGMAVAAALTISTGQPDIGTPPVGVVLVWLVVLAAHSFAGFLLGRRMPLVVAAPLALILSFVLTAYPAAMEPLWLRHMVTGGMSACCSLSQTPDWRAAASALVLALGVIAAAVVVLTVLARRVRTVLVTVALVAGLAGSGWLAYGLPADPVNARPADQLQCAGDNPRVCLWPELSRQADMIRQNAADARSRLQQAGLTVPAELTMDKQARQGALFIGAWPNPTPSQIRSGVAAALLPSGPPACAERGPFPGADAYGPTAAWLARTAGADPQDMAGRYGEPENAVATAVLRLPRSQQLAWFEHNSKALRDCTTHPAAAPSPRAQETSR